MGLKKETEYDPYAFLDEDPEKAKKTRDIANLIIVVLGMTVSIILSMFDRSLMVVAVGAMFLLVGIAGALYNRKTKVYPEQWLRPIAAIIVGAGGIVLPLMAMRDISTDEMYFAIIPALAMFTLLIGTLLVVSPLFEKAMKKRRCTETVMATCTAIDLKSSGRGGCRYEHIWEYPIGSIKVTASDHLIVSTRKPEVGSIERILVNPDDPNDIYRKATSRTVFMILTGSLILVISMVLFAALYMINGI